MMKLAEALIERAEIQKRNGQLIKRINNCAKVLEGDQAPEEHEGLIAAYEMNMARFLELIQRINKTNNQTPFDGETSITDAIAKRDCIGLRIKAYREFYEAATARDRYSRNEIRTIRCIDPGEMQRNIDMLSKEYREIDTKLQALNWSVELS